MNRLLLSSLVFAVFGAAAIAAACGADSAATTDDSADGGDSDASTAPTADAATGSDDDGINTTGVGAGTGAATGLPCDIQQLLENRCIGCHLATTPYPLLTYDDLMKPAPSDKTKTMAQRALERLSDGTMPPKPAEPPTSDEIDTFRAWVEAKTPKGAACTDGPDAGAGASSVFDTPTVCTSKTTWKNGDEESPDMHPGGACLTCHAQRGGPAYKVAGTVYPTAHEPNDCNGVATPVQIVITDAKGKVTTLDTNGVGNFFTRSKVFAPFKAKVTSGGKERAMAGAVTAGDCNSCHTEKGANGAPGRIMAP